MLKRLFKSSAPAAQTIARRSAAKRWASVVPTLGRRVRVERIDRETPDSVTVTIAPVDGGPLAFAAGQYLTHCFEVDGEIQRRAYSLSVPEGAGELAFTCKQVSDGCVSRYVCQQLQVGDEYEVRGPSGEFQLPAGNGPLVFVAAGSGITPCFSLLSTALARDPQRSITLIYGSRDQVHIIFRERLETLAAAHPNLRVVHVLSQPQSGWDGEVGHIDSERLLRLAAPGPDSEIFLCGPGALMDDLTAGLSAAGCGRVHREDFRSVNHATAAHPDLPQTIVFRRSGQQVEQQPGQSILEAALANDIALDFSCTVGGCAACKVKVLRGRIALDEPNCLSAQEQAEGYTLACSAFALEAVELDA